MRAMRSAFGVGAALARGVAFERNADGGGGGDIGGVDDVGRRALAPVAGVDQLQNATGGDEAPRLRTQVNAVSPLREF